MLSSEEYALALADQFYSAALGAGSWYAAQALVTANPGGDLETITVNVLAFLQSLDSDGNADNGITIASTVAGAMASNSINFVADAGAFTTALNSLVTTVESTAGIDLTVVSREQASEHFAGQVPNLVAGTYVAGTPSYTDAQCRRP